MEKKTCAFCYGRCIERRDGKFRYIEYETCRICSKHICDKCGDFSPTDCCSDCVKKTYPHAKEALEWTIKYEHNERRKNIEEYRTWWECRGCDNHLVELMDENQSSEDEFCDSCSHN